MRRLVGGSVDALPHELDVDTRLLVADRVQHDTVYVGFGGVGTVETVGLRGKEVVAC